MAGRLSGLQRKLNSLVCLFAYDGVQVGKLRALVRELARISVEDSPGSVESKGEAIKAFEQARAAEDDDVSDDLGSTQSWAGLRTDPTVALLRLKVRSESDG